MPTYQPKAETHGARAIGRVSDTIGGGGRRITDREPKGAEAWLAETSWNIVGSKRISVVIPSDILVIVLKRPVAATTAPRSIVRQPSSKGLEILKLMETVVKYMQSKAR